MSVKAVDRKTKINTPTKKRSGSSLKQLKVPTQKTSEVETISVKGIFETHISVANRHKAAEFYQRVAGLEFAGEFPERDITFLWVGGSKRNMLGLWGPGAADAPISRGKFHFAFEVTRGQLKTAAIQLKRMGVQPLDFHGQPTEEPDVLAWVPNLSLYFKDLDGHSIEFLAVLAENARPELGILKWSEWKKRR